MYLYSKSSPHHTSHKLSYFDKLCQLQVEEASTNQTVKFHLILFHIFTDMLQTNMWQMDKQTKQGL